MPDGIRDERRRRQEERLAEAMPAIVTSGAGLGSLGAAGVASVAGGFQEDSPNNRVLLDQLKLSGYRSTLPGLAPEFYAGADVFGNQLPAGGKDPDLERLRGNVGLIESEEDVYGSPRAMPGYPYGSDFGNRLALQTQYEANRSPDYVFDGGHSDGGENRVPSVRWDRTASALSNRDAKKPLTWATNVPEYGPDLGGFARRYGVEPREDQIKAYTVTPNTNSGRFSQRLLPDLIDDVYGRSSPIDLPAQGKGYYTNPEAGRIPGREAIRQVQTDLPGWQGKSLAEKVYLMDKMAPGQSAGGNQSSVLWGTTTDRPRYEYADVRDVQGPNPEIIVSYFRAAEDQQTPYKYTPNTHSPYVRRYSEPEGQYTAGPHWGQDDGDVPSNTGGRPRRDTRGDVHWRSDLTEARGAFSLADAQAVQQQLGIPLTAGKGEEAISQAVGSIRTKLGLNTDAEVVDRFARSVPRLGSTTAPRLPATVHEGTFVPDVRPGIPSAVQRAYDLPAALSNAGVPASWDGIRQVNAQVGRAASDELRGVRRFAAAAPAVGALAGVLDPEAAGLFARSASSTNPEQKRGLMLQGMEAFGRNTLTGAALGGATQLGARVLAARAPALAAQVLPMAGRALAVGGPVGLAASAYATADAVAEGLTGRSLTDRGVTAFRQNVSPAIVGPTSSQALSQLFPSPRSVPARTPTGTAVLTRTRPAPPSGPQRLLQGVANSGAGRAIRNELQRRSQQAAQARQRGSRIPGLPELGLSEFLFGRRR